MYKDKKSAAIDREFKKRFERLLAKRAEEKLNRLTVETSTGTEDQLDYFQDCEEDYYDNYGSTILEGPEEKRYELGTLGTLSANAEDIPSIRKTVKRIRERLVEDEAMDDGSSSSDESVEEDDNSTADSKDLEIYDYENDYELKSALENPEVITKIRDHLKKITLGEFNINDIGEALTEERDKFVAPLDDGMALWDGTEKGKGEFARGLRSWVHAHGIPATAEKELLLFLQETFPPGLFRLPLRLTERKRWVPNIDEYVPPMLKDVWFDICSSSCCVFVGPFAKFERCPQCNKDRFRPCTKPKCKKEKRCSCMAKDKMAWKQINYRPLIPLLKRLVRKEGFRAALKFVAPRKNDTIITDFLDGNVAKESLAAMHRQFELQFPGGDDDEGDVKEISLLLSEFYDGAQIFKRRVSSFWPLFISVMNLPPSYRHRIGIGTFLLSLFTAENGSVAEHFIFAKCFIQELKMLEKGFIISADGQRYFIQARLVLHVCDGRALEKLCKIQGAGALCRCTLCQGIYGLSRRTEMDRVVYLGHRGFCADTFFARPYGQTQLCCQSKLYDGGHGEEAMLPDAMDYDGKKYVYPRTFSPLKWEASGRPLCCECEGPGDKLAEDIARFQCDPKAAFSNAHESIVYDFNIFATSLYYLTCDFRKKRIYKRVTNRQYQKRGHRAEREGQPYKGVHGVWPFDELGYADFGRHVTVDPFHVCSGVAKNMHENQKGKRIKSDSKISKFCETVQAHPSLYKTLTDKEKSRAKVMSDDQAGAPPWEIVTSYQQRAEDAVNCIIVPSGHGREFALNDIYTASGHLRGTSMNMLYTALMELVLSVVFKMHVAYKAFYLIVSKDLMELSAMEFRIDNGEIERLTDRVFETAAIHEGVMPESEALHCWHTLCHIAPTIRDLGPPNSFSTLYGERAIPALKKGVPKGGPSFEKVVMARFTALEDTRMEGGYNFHASTLQPGKVSAAILKLQKEIHNPHCISVENGVLVHTYNRISLRNPLKSKECLLDFEIVHLIRNLCTYIEKIAFNGNEIAAIQRSVLYRVQTAYNVAHSSHQDTGLGDWKNVVEYVRVLYRGFVMRERIQEFQDLQTYWLEESDCAESDDLVDNTLLGVVYLSDVIEFHSLLVQCESIVCYRNADVLGTTFLSRGTHARERDVNTADGSPANPHSNLRSNWHLRRDYSSWVKLRSLEVEVTTAEVHPNDLVVEEHKSTTSATAYCVRSCRIDSLIPCGSVIVEVNGISTVNNAPGIETLFEQGNSKLKLCFVAGPVIDFMNYRWAHAWNALRKKISSRAEFRRTGTNVFNDIYQFAQVNTFFMLDFPADSAIHGLPMASVTARTHFNINVIRKADLRMNTHQAAQVLEFDGTQNDPNYVSHVATEQSFSDSLYFIPLTQVVPTPILVVPWYVKNFDVRGTAELKWPLRNEPSPYKLAHEKVKSKKKTRYAACSKDEITHFSLIDMYPARRKQKFYR